MENLYEIDAIFTDKTGTLTKNNMAFNSSFDSYGNVFNYNEHNHNEIDNAFKFCLALCNTVIYVPKYQDY